MVTVVRCFRAPPGPQRLVVSATLQWPRNATPARLIPLSRGKAPLYLRANPNVLTLAEPTHPVAAALRVTIPLKTRNANTVTVRNPTVAPPHPTVELDNTRPLPPYISQP